MNQLVLDYLKMTKALIKTGFLFAIAINQKTGLENYLKILSMM